MRGAICKRFSANAPPGALRIFVLISVVLRGRVLVFGARERSERVTTRRQPPRQRSRRTCIKTVTYFYGHNKFRFVYLFQVLFAIKIKALSSLDYKVKMC